MNESVVRAYELLSSVNPSRWPKPIRESFGSAMSDLTKTLEGLQRIEAGTWIDRTDARCAWCRDPMPVPDRPQGGGRTKLYCGWECRQAADRWKKNPNSLNRQQWLSTHRPGLDSTKE